MDFEGFFTFVMVTICVAVFGLLVYLPFVAYDSMQREERLMADCMKDHQEYECVGILRGRSVRVK